ncbi:hypothetical protein OG394_36215 [Kribbella sp. NBC_01245]|uniref:hypothetical protein n=1 Tax=Kribbella sp. NBC_01245 TaxID=2903578 RepID=UPI002E294F16|nr:hypothetical protein [Kribbella sp. NBC_01245]
MAIVIAALLGTTLTTPAAAAPGPGGGTNQESKAWSIDASGNGLRITLRLPEAIGLRAALPLLAVDGRPIGVARQSADGKTLTLVTTDSSVLGAKKVELVWSTELGKDGAARRSPQTGADWSKAAQGKPLPVDPGSTGKFKVDTSEYNLGDEAVYLSGIKAKSELRGKVYTPRGATGKRPLVVFLHGRHGFCHGTWPDPEPAKPWPCPAGTKATPSYRGYDAPAKALASHGYQVVSISSNAINAYDGDAFDSGAFARAELILKHLDLWRKWSTIGGSPFGKKYVGKVNLANVGLMGHSRGGEGVVRAALLNAERGAKYGIRAVLPLAPVDFARATLPGTAMSVILPYCDGDVSDLQGQHFHDDTMYAAGGDRAARSTVLVMGANHNFFNTEWTPGQSEAPSGDDWWGEEKAEPCGGKAAARLKPLEQQAVGRAYIAGFFRLELGRETALLPLLDGSSTRAASAGRAITRVVAQAPATNRYDLARLDRPLPAGSITGKATAKVCTGMAYPPPSPLKAMSKAPASPCLVHENSSLFPHWTPAAYSPEAPTTSVTQLKWTGTDGVMRFALPVGKRDVRRFAALSFRTAPGLEVKQKTDFTVRIVDGKGKLVDLPVSALSDALVQLPGNEGSIPKTMLRTVRIALAGLKGLDLKDIRSIEFRTNKAATGSAYISNLALSKAALSVSAPSTLPRLSVNDLGTIKEGDTGSQTLTYTVKLSRPSAVPVTVNAEAAADSIYRSAGDEPVYRKLVFKPGQTTQQVSVRVDGNTRDGYDQRLSLVLSAPTGAIVGQSFGQTLVLDDDPDAVLTVGDGVGTEGGMIRFPMKLSGPSDKFIYAAGRLASGTAILGKDFRSSQDQGGTPPETQEFGSLQQGETEGWVEVPALADTEAEPDEKFTFTVTEMNGKQLPKPLVLTGTIHNKP